MDTISSEGAVFYQGSPLLNFQVLLAAQLGRETPGDEAPGRTEPWADSQELTGARQRRAVSEGTLLPTGRADPAPSGSRGAARGGENTSAWERAGGESGRFGWR